MEGKNETPELIHYQVGTKYRKSVSKLGISPLSEYICIKKVGYARMLKTSQNLTDTFDILLHFFGCKTARNEALCTHFFLKHNHVTAEQI